MIALLPTFTAQYSMLFRLIATIAMAVVVLAAPTADGNIKGDNNGMAIPLTKHSSYGRGRISSWITQRTIRGMNIFERNMGTPHPISVVKQNASPRSSGGNVDLTNFENVMWYGIISIGTPAKSFTVQFDTGSRPSDLIVPGLTGNENCRGHSNLWDPTSSSSARALNRYFGIEFEDDAIVKGKQYMDNVTIAGFTADVQTIGVATEYSSEMAASNFPADGILGLAFPSLSECDGRSPLLHTLFSEEKLSQPVFSLKLTASGGELYVGGMNKALFIDTSLTFTAVTVSGFWQLRIDHIKVNDKIILTDVPAIIDTGANFIVGDPSRVLALHKAYGGDVFEYGYYTFPCRSFPSVTLTIGGKPYLIPANVLKQEQVAPGSSDCFSGIVAPETNNAPNLWEIGAIFLQLFYTVFDFGSDPPRVGFAKLAS